MRKLITTHMVITARTSDLLADRKAVDTAFSEQAYGQCHKLPGGPLPVQGY